MSKILKASMAVWFVGLLATVSSLIHTTPISMMVFFFVGMPAFALAAALYLSELFLVLRRRDVL